MSQASNVPDSRARAMPTRGASVTTVQAGAGSKRPEGRAASDIHRLERGATGVDLSSDSSRRGEDSQGVGEESLAAGLHSRTELERRDDGQGEEQDGHWTEALRE